MGDEIGMIGVCGMGGIGKTTIMKDVHNRLLKESKFRKLIWVTVSQEFDIRRLQTNIACQLGGNLSDDEDTIVCAGKLSNMLGEQGRYVLILNDVWKSFSLEDVGILETTSNDGCKIVLTTRAERVAQSMGFKKVRVPCLSMEEAMDLFLSKVGQDVLLNPTLESFMNLVVRECDGLPLAIVTLAGCMRGISNPRVWENAIDELRGYIQNLHDMEDKVYGCLKFSYDRLEQTDKDCFLCCAFYPEDCEIGKEEIIEYWIEAGLIDEMGSRKAMEHCGHSILQKLEENCLLERVQEIGKGTRLSWFSSSLYIEKDTHIKMHDLVRDMALHITRKRFMVKAGKQLKELPHEEEWSEDLETVSLMHNSISTIPQTMKCPKFPRLTSLLLSRNSLKEIPNSFFDHFPNLKILDLSYNHFESLPNSISSLEKLTVLLPTACYLLKSLPSLSKLQALKKLDIGFSGVEEMPQGVEMLVDLKYLNLGHIRRLKEIPNGLLSKLCRLQYLATDYSILNAEDMRELKKLEVFVGRFSNIGDLSIYAYQRKMLYKYSILLCQPESFIFVPCASSKLVTFKNFEFNHGDAIILPYDIQQLHLKGCYGIRSLNEIRLRDATDLKVCKLEFCDNLESVFSSKCDQLRTLEYLTLKQLLNLEVIVGVGAGKSSVGTFSFLKEITLWDCSKTKHLFSATSVLHNLEVMNAGDCGKLEEIIMNTENQGLSFNNGTIEFTYPKLKNLSLSNFPKLKSICSENGVMVCDSLEFIKIDYCAQLKRIPLYLPQLETDNEGKLSPNSLKVIRVYPRDWWETVDWEHPKFNVKNVFRPLLECRDHRSDEWNKFEEISLNP